MKTLSQISLLFIILLTACSPNPQTAQVGLESAPPTVQAAAPSGDSAPAPAPIPIAASDPDLAQIPPGNVFCEYEFCIGHSPGLYYYDPAAERVQTNSFEAGILLSCCSAKTDSFLVWQSVSEDLWDPSGDIERVVGVGLEKRGEAGQMTINDFEVTYQPVQDPQASPDTGWPYGVLAAWHCGKRGYLLSLMFDSEVDTVAQMEKQVNTFQCFE